jgi:predicted RNA-binding Zn ribbon-like protein
VTGRPIEFIFVGNHAALDFVNTELALPAGRVDLLQSDDDLVAWATAAGLDVTGLPRRVSHDHLEPGARRLRSALRESFEAVVERRRPKRDALNVLNELLTGPSPGSGLKYQDGKFVALPAVATGPIDLVRQIAVEGAAFLTGVDPGMVRRCAGNSCTVLFHDVSKGHRRRWCSMAICGNRAKVAAHERRQREG